MATTERHSGFANLSRVGDFLLAGRPLVALVAVLLTTGGHTMNLREMGVSQGWVPAEVYALQSCYLVSLALTMLACPALAQGWSIRRLTETGLVLAVAGSLLNVNDAWEPLTVFLIGRAVAGIGAGMVIYFAPLLLDSRWQVSVAWAAILCPVAGPGAVSIATMMNESSDWRNGFLFEGAAAAVGLLLLLSMSETPEPSEQPRRGSLTYLSCLAVASAAFLYCLHWGQLHGWHESPDIVAGAVICVCALGISIHLVWPRLDWSIFRDNWVRLALFFFGGMCQFFHGYIMNIYGGMLVNLSSWQRAWLIWPLPIGIATSLIAASLAAPHLTWRRGRAALALASVVSGLLLLAAGLYLLYDHMMEWPYWNVRDTVDLNWFPAPGQWELAPGRFLMGLGIGLFMVAMDTQFSPDPDHEETVRPLLNVVQFFGGGLAAAVLINLLIIAHKIHYSYTAERDAIQADELSQRAALLSDVLRQAGQASPDRSAEVLLYRFVNYEADNLVFATIYAIFMITALSLAACFFGLWVWRRLRRASGSPAASEG